MKKQNQNNKLPFNKGTVTELNRKELGLVNGGTSTLLPSSISIAIVIYTGGEDGQFIQITR